MTQAEDYPSEAPTGPHTAVMPEAPYGHDPRGFAYPPVAPGPPPQFPQTKPPRLNRVAAWVGIAAGSLVIIAVLFGSGFYLGRETAPQPVAPAAAGNEQGGPMIFPMPRGQFERPGPGIVTPTDRRSSYRTSSRNSRCRRRRRRLRGPVNRRGNGGSDDGERPHSRFIGVS